MKVITFLRHSKSSWENNIDDINRPLSEIGIEKIKKIANSSKHHFISSEIIFTSSANRALYTSVLLSRTLSINLNNDTFAIYPNPIIDELNVLSFSNEQYTFDIYSVNGRLVFSKEFQGFRSKTNLDFLSKGIYILKLSDENNNETLLKILKR